MDTKMIKDKIKTYTCRYCKEKFDMTMFKYSLRSMTGLKGYCEKIDCMAKAAMKVIEKQKESDRRQWKKRKRNLELEVGKKKQPSQEPLQKAVNKIVRLIDKDQPCICRPTENHQHFDAGHLYSSGSWKSLTYHMWNIHKQSVKSNQHNDGEPTLMLEGIEIRYGKERKEYIENLKKVYPVLRLTAWEKREALKIANQIIRDIENKGKVYTRDDVNDMLGIYTKENLK